MRSLLAPLVLLLAALPLPAQSAPAITLVNDGVRERGTRDQLLRLAATYDLSPWRFTDSIRIEGGINVIPHSHPVLTLSTRHLKDDDLLLATYIHEQLHWYMAANRPKWEAAAAELRTLFPDAPTRGKEGGGEGVTTYVHIIVCWLEYQGIRSLLGELRAKQVMDFWMQDHYTWVYRTVVERDGELRALLVRHALFPVRRE